MNPNARFERDLEQWLQTEAPASAPAGFHATVMDRARTLRQRPGWATTLPARRFGRGRGMTLLAAAALLLVGGALAAGSGILRLPSVVPPMPAPSVVAVATESPDATLPSPSESAGPSASPIPVAGPGGVWIATGSMVTPRRGHAAVRLLDGRVLVVGGQDAWEEPLTSAELYDPATGTWSATESISRPLYFNEATLLRDGRVLVADRDRAQLYDPASGTWTATGPMVRGSGFPDMFTVLRDGRVLVVGGDGAQVYDPASGTLTATGEKNDQGRGAAATLLSDGKVLVAGGTVFSLANGYDDLDSAEVYDPVTGSWTAIANRHANASPVAAFLQPDGKVLVVGSDSVEAYDPATDTWTALPVRPGIWYDDASQLSDGTVLVTGDLDGDADGAACTAAELYDRRTGSWTSASTMLGCASPGAARSLTLLLDGTVLVAGGKACSDGLCVATGAAEVYVPAGVSLPPFDFPTPPPPVFPSPTPVPTPLPPADGPVPPNARSWKVTVDNQSSEPATLFVAEEDEGGMLRLVGSATPNVVPAGATVKVTFLFPAKPDDGWIYVNPRPGDGGGLVNAAQIGIPGRILIRAEGDAGWLSP